MNTRGRHGWTAAFLLAASACPACANDMTMVLPIVAAPFLVAGLVLAIALWIMARTTRVRTGVLTAILIVGALLSGIPGAIVALISINYISSRYGGIAISYLIGFLVYVAVVVLAFRGIRRRKQCGTADEYVAEVVKRWLNQASEGSRSMAEELRSGRFMASAGGQTLRATIHLGLIVILWTVGVSLSEEPRCYPIGYGFAVPIPLVLGLVASVPFALGLARIQVSGDSFRCGLLRFLRHVPLAGAVAPVALTGVLCAVLYVAGLFERAVASPRLLLELSGSVVLTVVLALLCGGRRKPQGSGVHLPPRDGTHPSATPGEADAPAGTPQARGRRPVCGILAWAAPMLAVPAGMGVIYGLAAAFEGSEAMNDFKGMSTGLAIIGMGFVPLLVSVPTSLILAIVSLRRRERCPGLAVSLLAAYGAISGFLLFGPWGLLAAYLVAVVLSAAWLARRAGRACAPTGAMATGQPPDAAAGAADGAAPRTLADRVRRFARPVVNWTHRSAQGGSAGQNVQLEKGGVMTGAQMKTVGIGGALLAILIVCIIYIDARSGHGRKPVENTSPSPAPEAGTADIAAAEAARLEREHQAGLAADAEAERLAQERQAKLAADAQAARAEQERDAARVADVEASPPGQPPAGQVAAIAPGVATAEYKLTGIMGVKGKYGALLNNQVYQAGDKLGEATILGVASKEVTIEITAGTTVKLHIGERVTVPATQRDAAALPGESVTRPVAQPDSSVLPPDLRKGLLAYYPFNRNEGSRVSDLSDSRRNATAENVAWTPNGKVGGAMVFNPKGSRIIASDQGLPEGDAPRSIAFWKKTGSKNEILVCMLTYGKQQAGLQCSLGMDWRVGRSGILVSPSGSCNVAGQRLENERWYHVVYCYGGGGKHAIYINGATEPLSVREFSTFNTQLAGRLMLGDSDEQAPSFDGCLDEVMIYDRVLSPDEVRQIYERQ